MNYDTPSWAASNNSRAVSFQEGANQRRKKKLPSLRIKIEGSFYAPPSPLQITFKSENGQLVYGFNPSYQSEQVGYGHNNKKQNNKLNQIKYKS